MALILCKQCGSPVSSKSKACPVCGTPLSAPEQEAVKQSAPVEPVAPVEQSVGTAPAEQPVGTAPAEPAISASQPKTLNDILAESSKPRTLHDTLSTEETKATTAHTPTPAPAPMPIPTTEGASEAEYYDDGYDADVEDLQNELQRKNRSIRGLYIAVIVLILLLLPAGYFLVRYGKKIKTVEQDYALVESARKLFEEQNAMLQHDAEDLVAELENLKDRNDTMMVKYNEAVVMLEQLQREKTYNYDQLARYKREVETLKGVMKGYLRQIDSLNNINRNLQAENIEYKKEIGDAQLRADVAEEKADELNTKVRIGAVIRCSGIRAALINERGKEVKVNRATRMRVDFDLTANELAEPGEKSVYLCITDPQGYVMAQQSPILFMFEGEEMMASAVRKVDYENQTVPVSIFYDSEKFEKGTYRFEIYIDGRLSGSQESYFE